jgi:hypothetical protein
MDGVVMLVCIHTCICICCVNKNLWLPTTSAASRQTDNQIFESSSSLSRYYCLVDVVWLQDGVAILGSDKCCVGGEHGTQRPHHIISCETSHAEGMTTNRAGLDMLFNINEKYYEGPPMRHRLFDDEMD